MRYILLALGLLACDRSAASRPAIGGQQVGTTGSTHMSAVPLPCGVRAGSTLTGSGIGEIQIGHSVDSIRRVCSVTRDTTVLGGEGLPERVISVAVARDTINAIVDNGRVWRIHIEQPDIRTADSLGVGSRISDLIRDTRARGAEGEGVLYLLLPSHCGLSFRIAHDVADNEHRANWSTRDLRALPQDSRVDQVLIMGCKE